MMVYYLLFTLLCSTKENRPSTIFYELKRIANEKIYEKIIGGLWKGD